MQPQRPQVVEADLERVERIKVAAVALDEIPLDARLLARLDDAGPVEIARAYLGHDVSLIRAEFHVLKVNCGDSASNLVDPCRGIAAALGNPVCVDFKSDTL